MSERLSSTCTSHAWLPLALSLSWEPKFSLLHTHRKEETRHRRSQIDCGQWLSGGECTRQSHQWLICWVKRGQPPPLWSAKSQRPPAEAEVPEKAMQLQGQFCHGLSSFPAELNKRWRVVKWLRHLLQWVGDSSGFRKNSGFFLAHRPIFQTVFSFDYSCFHFIWFPLSKIRSIKLKLYCGLVKHSNTQRSLYWMQAICWGSLSAKHRLMKAARLTVLSHTTAEHFPCLQLPIQDFFHL